MIRKSLRRCATAILLAGLGASNAHAQTATQTVTFAANAINLIAFTGSPSLIISTAVAGSAPTSVTSAVATWAVTTNQSGAKITASIASNMPAGVTLSTSLVAPVGATSAGFKALSTVPADAVTGLTKVAQGAMGVTYRLDATAAAGVIASSSRIVTYTITGGT